MNQQEFDIVFRGDIVFGHQLAEVKLRLQQLFKADAAKVDALFSGRPVPLKRGLDQLSAQKYKAALLQAGAQVDIVASGDATSAVLTPAVLTPAVPVAATTVVNANAQANWSLAPAGADLLLPAERAVDTPRIIDISALSVRPEGGRLLDASEQSPRPIARVSVPDFEVAEVGADLVRAYEKVALPLAEIIREDWGLAELGTDLIAATEKPPRATPVIHIPEVGLAPAGTDLGQLKVQVKAVVPDVSAIRLVDQA